jgi:hypothetical protein
MTEQGSEQVSEQHQETAGAVRYERGEDGVVVLVLDDPQQSANTMNDAYVLGMGAAVDRLEAERDGAPGLTGVIVTSAKKTFFAGGDITLMSQARPENAGELTRRSRCWPGRPSAAGWRSPWPVTGGSRWTPRGSGSGSPRSPWACCPGPAG